MVRSRITTTEPVRSFVRYWHKAADHILICEGRFRSKADMNRSAASTASVADDPKPTSSGEWTFPPHNLKRKAYGSDFTWTCLQRARDMPSHLCRCQRRNSHGRHRY